MAVTLTALQLGPAIGVDAATATRLLAVTTALVDGYAPGAPDAVSNEAVIRASGWLNEQPAASIRREDMGDISTSYVATQLGVLLHSGAKGLLYSWRVKTAGICK